MSSTEPLGFAMLGAGIFAAEAHLPALAQLSSSTALLAVYSRSLQSASTFADLAKKVLALPSPPAIYHDGGGANANLDALLQRPDINAVIIALPIIVQPDIITAALAHGKHVISEKPVAPTVAEGLELIEQYEKRWQGKLLWRVAENFEAEPAFRKVGALIKEGKIGKVVWWKLAVVDRLSKDNKYYKTPWRTVPEYQGGFLLDGGVHSAALLHTALPSYPVSLSAHVSLAQEHLAPVDTFTALVKSSDGSHGLFEHSAGAPVASRSEVSFKVTGESGWIVVAYAPGAYRVVLHTIASEKDTEDEQTFETKSEGVKKELEHFVNAIKGEGHEEIGMPREALRDVAFIQAGLGSKGKQVDIERLAREGK